MAKYKYSSPVTPQGIFRYAWVDKPDTKFDENGKYKVTLLIDDNDENREWCETQTKKAAKEAKEAGDVKLRKKFKMPIIFPEDIDEEDFEEDDEGNKPKYSEECRGKIIIDAKSGFKPGAIDAKKQTLSDSVKIMGGDVGKIKVQFRPYDGFGSGISFGLKTVQLIEKNTTFQGGTDTEGFDEEEDGFTQNPEDSDDEEDDEIPF